MKNTGISIWILACALLSAIPAYSQIFVWPGDANNDGMVNNVDVLYLGLGYNTQGIARDTITIVWGMHDVMPWPGRLSDSTNYAYMDCDGNGFINEDDLQAIDLNYGLTHGNTMVDSLPPVNGNSPIFYFVGGPTTYGASDTVHIDLYAGTTTLPAEFFGVAFTLSYDTALIKANTLVVTPDSLLDSPIDRVLFLSAHASGIDNGLLEIGITRRANTGGSTGTPILLAGHRLATISFIIEDNLIGKMASAPLELNISNVLLTGLGLTKQAGHNAAASIPFEEKVGVDPSPAFDALKIYPQPTSGKLILEGLPSNGHYTITDLSGKILVDQSFETNNTHEVDCSHLNTGMYLITIETQAGKVVKKILID